MNMQCRGINCKDGSQLTYFGKFGSKYASEVGVLWKKKLKVGEAKPSRLSIFFSKVPQPPKHTLEAKFSKVRQLRAVFTINTPTLHVHAQSNSDSIFGRRIEEVCSLLGLDRFNFFPETCSNKCLIFSSASCNLVLDNIMQEEFSEKI